MDILPFLGFLYLDGFIVILLRDSAFGDTGNEWKDEFEYPRNVTHA